MTDDVGLDALNALPDAAGRFVACCAAPGWAARVSAGRPYRDRAALADAADAALSALDWAGVAAALDAHPRIGRQPSGTGPGATWSRREQHGMAAAAAADTAALAAGNAAYEERFGHVFLVCASGRSAAELRAELDRRLTNDPDAERAEVRRELAGIVRLRLGSLLSDLADPAPNPTPAPAPRSEVGR